MRKKTKKLFIILLSIVVILCGGIYLGYEYIDNINYVKLKENSEELKVSESTSEKSKKAGIENILLLGVDKQENASDSIMVLTIDKTHNKLKLSSIMRDTRIYLGDDKVNKINYAYHYGGPAKTISVINEEFDLDIQKYALISFEGLINVIDYFGGVELEITQAERDYLKNLPSANSNGLVTLNGSQALAYSRIRYIDSDSVRTSRQRNVIMSLFNKVSDVSITEIPKLISDISSNVETNLSLSEIVNIAKTIITMDVSNIEDFRIPIDNTIEHTFERGVYILGWNKDINVDALHDFIYGTV